MNSRGQSSLEAAVSMMVVMLLVQTLLATVFFCGLKLFIDYRAHEAMVCGAQGPSEHCRLRLKQELEKFLIFGHLEHLSLIKNQQRISIQIFLRFPSFNGPILWKFKDQISLPLKS